VRYGEGDGSVPLISLGYMCSNAWKHKLLNPSQLQSIVREYRHDPSIFDLRGGIDTADHVDMMGNYDLIKDVLSIVTGGSDANHDVISSNILEIGALIDKRIGFK